MEQFTHNALCILGFFLHHFLGQRFHGHVLIGQPCFQLHHAGGILKARDLLRPLVGFLGELAVHDEGGAHQLLVDADAPVVDDLIQRV